MFKVIATIVAPVAALFMFAGMASADPVTDQCARALPQFQAQCIAQDGAEPSGPGVGPARGTAPSRYLADYKTPEKILDKNGNPVLDQFGRETWTTGEPVYATKPGTDGPMFEGYQYK